MNNHMEYRIITNWTIEGLQREVSSYLAKGWQPTGGPIIIPHDSNWAQAVVYDSHPHDSSKSRVLIEACAVALTDPNSIDAQLRYVFSEAGEMTDAFNVECGTTQKPIIESSTSEAVDVMLAAIGFIAANNRHCTPQQLVDMINQVMLEKTSKWANKLSKGAPK